MNMEKGPTETILGRIDAMIQELQALRQMLAVQLEVRPPAASLTDDLYGALAPATGADDGYDPYLDWERFGS